MTQEDKELLLKDLCARLPYGVKIETPIDCWSRDTDVCELKEIFKGDDGLFRIGDIGALLEYSKPYLFPMSSMTEEQKKEFIKVAWYEVREEDCGRHQETYYYDLVGHENVLYPNSDAIDWLNAHHFDYRGLIEKGLAIDATSKNIY